MVFPGDGGGQFHELRLAEFATEGGEEVVVDGCRSAGHGNGQTENELLGGGKHGAGFEARDLAQLGLGDSSFSASGRMDIDSKRTAGEHRDLELRELLESDRDGPGRGDNRVQPRRGEKRGGVVGDEGFRLWDQAYALFDGAIDQLRDPAGLGFADTVYSVHDIKMRGRQGRSRTLE